MQTSKILIPGTPAKPDLGDVLFGQEYIAEFPKSIIGLKVVLLKQENILRSDIFWKELLNVKYQCPWTSNLYYWWYPIALITNKPNPNDFVLTIKSEANDITEIEPQTLLNRRIATAMMGHGYTVGTLPSDGSSSKVFAKVNLDNGDSLLVLCWIWYNK